MGKYLCEICQKEVYNPVISIDMTGKILCSDHYAEFMGIDLNKGLPLISYVGYAETKKDIEKIIKETNDDINEERIKERCRYSHNNFSEFIEKDLGIKLNFFQKINIWFTYKILKIKDIFYYNYRK